jgi:hypothetical protein
LQQFFSNQIKKWSLGKMITQKMIFPARILPYYLCWSLTIPYNLAAAQVRGQPLGKAAGTRVADIFIIDSINSTVHARGL